MINKRYISKKTVALASLISLGAISLYAPVQSFAEETKVIGTFEATILDVKIPAKTSFIYNPNTEEMKAEKLEVKSDTNAPIYLSLQEINVSESSNWKPSLISPDIYTDEKWRNLTKAQSKGELSLGIEALEGDNWLTKIDNKSIWSSETNEKNKIGTIVNHGTIETLPIIKAGNSIPTTEILETNYIFEFGLEEGVTVPEDDKYFTIDMKDDIIFNPNGTIGFKPGTWSLVGSKPDYSQSEGSFHMYNKSDLSYYQYKLPKISTATFEITVKTLENTSDLNSSMAIETGSTGIRMYFYPDRIVAGTLTHYLDGTKYHTYRIVKENENVTVYVDGKNVGETKALGSNNAYRFFFGDGTSMRGRADAYYKDVRIAPGEALYLN